MLWACRILARVEVRHCDCEWRDRVTRLDLKDDHDEREIDFSRASNSAEKSRQNLQPVVLHGRILFHWCCFEVEVDLSVDKTIKWSDFGKSSAEEVDVRS